MNAEVSKALTECGTTIPELRARFAQGFSFSHLDFESQLSIWHEVYSTAKSPLEQRFPYFFLEGQLKYNSLYRRLWEVSCAWQEFVDDWSNCDGLAKVNTKVLEYYPELVLPVLQSWNTSGNLWKRRQSVVSLLYFQRTKKIFLPFEQIAAMVFPLLGDAEYYVQKGVGWCIKELYQVYPELTFEFSKQHIGKISPLAYPIVLEKMSVEHATAIKALRNRK